MNRIGFDSSTDFRKSGDHVRPSWGRRVVTLVLPALLFFSPAGLRAQFSGFAVDGEGWTIVSFGNLSANDYSIIGTYSVTYFASGGNPGGYIFSSDPDGGDFTFSAPAKFLGNQSAAYGSTLTYSLNDTSGVNYNTTDVMLVGGGLRLLWQQSPVLTPVTAFTSVTVPLAPSGQWHVGTTTGSLATISDFTTVLGSLTGLFIRGEYAFGSDSPGLDNVQFGTVPEPATLALLVTGLIPVGWMARRQMRKRERA